MHIRLKRVLFCGLILAAMIGLFCFSASAFEYSGSIDDVNLSTYKIDIGGTTLPLAKYPAGSFSPYANGSSTNYANYMTVAEAKEYGITLSKDLWLMSSECMAFARYVYAALYYKYPATASMDGYIASRINTSGSYAYVDMIKSPWAGGSYSADEFEKLIKSCYPGSFIRQGYHSMVIMSIFDDGLIVYDANFTNVPSEYNIVGVRKYTWDQYIKTFGSRTIEALQTPSYYPGYRDSLGRSGGGAFDYNLDTAKAGTYRVTANGSLNVRSGPSTSYSIVGSISGGTNVEVLGIYSGWAAIEYNGAACWLSMDYLALVDLAPKVDGYLIDTTFAGEYEVNNSFLNVRPLPTTAYAKVGTLYKGDVIDVLGTYNGWAAFKYNNDDCWVSIDYLTPYASKITVTFDANGGTASASTQSYTIGAAFDTMPTVSKSDRTFLGWFSGGTKYTETSVVPSGDFTLTAKWSLFTYMDVPEEEWYVPAVTFVYEKGYMNGLSADEFAPNGELTRAMMAKILHNLEGMPVVTDDSRQTFTDVDSDDWYYDAVEWAADKGLVNGRGDGTFDPESNITRQEMITMIHRYVTAFHTDSGDRADLSHFTDQAQIDAYAMDAMQWAVAAGVVNGMGDGTIAPKNTATRAQIANIMMKFFR